MGCGKLFPARDMADLFPDRRTGACMRCMGAEDDAADCMDFDGEDRSDDDEQEQDKKKGSKKQR